ncbi:MAG: fumarylacetoacetate hydrolase family protein [Chitinophagaceae bacterium]|jgi:2-keto-4-pentenoate hydratase/2-oxohepta-3-ene-1,7-dioic acid hydratase in catechol pathway
MKIVCIGRNYAEHAKELNNNIPSEPIIFLKPKTALLLDEKPLYYPEYTNDLQYECELVIKMSKNGKYIQEKFARNYYNAMTLGIDFTARDIQQKQKEKGLPWEIAKAFDGSAAVGRFVPIEPETTMQNLNFVLKINGETKQVGNTADMLFSIDKIIAYTSQFFTLNIGDLIFTGTPSGVGSLSVTDELIGYLEGEELLNCLIK